MSGSRWWHWTACALSSLLGVSVALFAGHAWLLGLYFLALLTSIAFNLVYGCSLAHSYPGFFGQFAVETITQLALGALALRLHRSGQQRAEEAMLPRLKPHFED